MYRTEGNITFEDYDSDIVKDFANSDDKLILNANLKSESFSFFQWLTPLSEENPCFIVQINDLSRNGNVTIGIASFDINTSISPGAWNDTIGYESLTGKCTSSHRLNANTLGRPVFEGDTFGVLVTHFGTNQSTVVFLLNNEPVATRYHFEKNHLKYLPTITFESGPIEIDLFLPNVVDQDLIPLFNLKRDIGFIKPTLENCIYGDENNEYINLQKTEDMPLQSPVSLSKMHPYYTCTQLDISERSMGASVGIASCSPLKPTPTCDLLRDYYTWLPKMKLQAGSAIGWGIIYNPDTPSVNDKAEQLVLVYVTLDESIVDVLFVLQPEGGFYPLVLMQPWATKIQISFKNSTNSIYVNKLKRLFYHKLQPALEVYSKDIEATTIRTNDIITNNSIIDIRTENLKTCFKIPEGNPGVYYIQYNKPLVPERRFYFIEIVDSDPVKSNVVIGVAPASFLNINNNQKLPGEVIDTIGYHSLSGQMFTNCKSNGNMMGHKCSKGDSMGLEIEVFEQKMSVAIFSKNFKPVGTRFLTLEDHNSFLATIGLVSGGEEIKINVYWHTVVSMPPNFNIRNSEDWCFPENTKVDPIEKIFTLPDHLDHSLCIQAPYSLQHKYNHFEIILIDDIDKNNPPPAIALCTASPFDPPPVSKFKQDFLRFWPYGEAMSAVKKNDRIGWGIFYVDDELRHDDEQLIICFLTINRNVVYLRVLHQPPGGFYPVVIAPPNVYRIKMEPMGSRVNTEDLKSDQIRLAILDASKQLDNEKNMIAQGKNPRELGDKRSKLCTIL